METLGWWRAFLDSLDTGGGYVIGFFLLIGIGLYLMRLGYDMIGATFLSSALAAYLTRTKDSRSNREQLAGPPALTATVTTAPAPQPDPIPEGAPK